MVSSQRDLFFHGLMKEGLFQPVGPECRAHATLGTSWPPPSSPLSFHSPSLPLSRQQPLFVRPCKPYAHSNSPPARNRDRECVCVRSTVTHMQRRLIYARFPQKPDLELRRKERARDARPPYYTSDATPNFPIDLDNLSNLASLDLLFSSPSFSRGRERDVWWAFSPCPDRRHVIGRAGKTLEPSAVPNTYHRRTK